VKILPETHRRNCSVNGFVAGPSVSRRAGKPELPNFSTGTLVAPPKADRNSRGVVPMASTVFNAST
jgi:hypothetical protein